MQLVYFFRDVRNYDELIVKTRQAYRRNSLNKRKALITKVIELEEKEFNNIISHMRRNNEIFFDNKDNMRIENGVWKCILLKSQDRKIAVMSDGYQYARFVALIEEIAEKTSN